MEKKTTSARRPGVDALLASVQLDCAPVDLVEGLRGDVIELMGDALRSGVLTQKDVDCFTHDRSCSPVDALMTRGS